MAIEEIVEPAVPADLTRVGAVTTALTGRFIVSAGTKHFVSDARAAAGGPGEAVGAGELLLSALASCALGLIQDYGRSQGAPFREISVLASFKRDAEDPSRFEYIRLAVRYGGEVSEVYGQAGIENFTMKCPIYNTLKRGGVISIARE